VADRLRGEGFDWLLATPGSNLAYLTGVRLGRSERLIAMVLGSDGSCRFLAPAFEAENLAARGIPGELRTWKETEDPIPILAAMLARPDAPPRLAVEGTTWFDTLAPLARILPAARIASASPILAPIRMRKEPEEIALIEAAARITLHAIRKVMAEAREGMTEQDLLGRAAGHAAEAGGDLQGLVQFGPDSAVPHSPAGDRKLRGSDVILLDLVTSVRGYHCDVSRTFAFGAPLPRFPEIYKTVREAQQTGFRAARAGVTAGSVDDAARAVIRAAGYAKYFTHRLGHGVGLDGHEEPYLVGGNRVVLEEGTTVTVEPGVYLPGEFGVRIEDDIQITASLPRILTADPR
jgi:Xaa-Pro dipeptidase